MPPEKMRLKALSMTSRWDDFGMKPSAPRSRALITRSRSWWPESTTTDVVGWRSPSSERWLIHRLIATDSSLRWSHKHSRGASESNHHPANGRRRDVEARLRCGEE